jgi:predicted dehydrogenase
LAERLKVGLIGCGRIAQYFHLQILSQSPAVNLVALAEADGERLASARRVAPSAEGFEDYRGLLKRDDVEAVVICLPTGMHADAATAAFSAGKHVYLEKPMATDLAEADRVMVAWEASGKAGAIGFNYRFHSLFQDMKRRVERGEIGELVGARSVFSGAAQDLLPWKQKRETGGGVLLDLASHHVDLVRYIFRQEIQEVSAQVRSVRSEEDTASLVMRLSDGLLVQSFFSASSVEEGRLEIYGTKGALRVDRYLTTRPEFTRPKRAYGKVERLLRGFGVLGSSSRQLWKVLMPQTEPSYEAALNSFVESVSQGKPMVADLRDGYRSLSIVLAAEASARSCGVVTVAVDAHETPWRNH